MSNRLTHLDDAGAARMVDVRAKPDSDRAARARALVRMTPACARQLAGGELPKGDALTVARLAGINAAKLAGTLIPLAHPLGLDFADVQISVDVAAGVALIETSAAVRARTGVEMEAMTAASVAALALYDMVKSVDRGAVIERVELLEKSGGRSGHWRRQASG